MDEIVAAWVLDSMDYDGDGNVQESLYFGYHRAAVNSVRVITDEAGSIVETYDYDEYGNVTIRNPAGTAITASRIGNTFMYTGREFDSETGLFHYRARHYDTSVGVFLQRDPLGFVDGFNLYAYVSNNPFGAVDPYGLDDRPWYKRMGSYLGGVGKGIVKGAFAVVSAPVKLGMHWGNNIKDAQKANPGGNAWANAGVGTAQTAVDTAHAATVGAAQGAAEYVDAFGQYMNGEIGEAEFGEKLGEAFGSSATGGAFGRLCRGRGADFEADLSLSNAKSRSGHRNAANKQLHEAMERDPKLRAAIQKKFGSDAFDRTSTSGKGRRNPRDAEWHHDSKNPNAMHLMSKSAHKKHHQTFGSVGGYAMHWGGRE